MALPKQVRPEYTTTIPSNGKRIKFHPFSVKEEKVLILAAESQDPDEIANAVRNCLERCVTTPQFKVDELALFDIEYLFLKARSKSAGETIKVVVRDPNDETFTVDHDIKIDSIKVEKTKGHTDLIKINDETTIKMKYPDISFFENGIDFTSLQNMTSNVGKCISQIVVGEEVYSRADLSEEEIMDWVEGLTQKDYKKILNFFETMPRLKHSFTKKNTNNDTEFTITLEGLADFF